MKEWRRYTCDFGHSWEFYREHDAEEKPDDVVCPNGHEAVTRQIEPHADRTRITILPASRLIDSVTGRVAPEDSYLVLISQPDGSEERMSTKRYGWSEVIKITERFRNKEFSRSLDLWNKIEP